VIRAHACAVQLERKWNRMAAPNPERQKSARQRIAELFRHPATVYVIHYACQSFNHGRQLQSPRVTSIVARNVGTGHTETFSLQAEAELLGLSPVGVLARMDGLERNMLDKFFRFVAINRHARFVHWKMRNATYGFAAIEHRYSVLGGGPIGIPEMQRFDLAWLLEEIYGSDYVEAPHFETLARLNKLSLANFLSGEREAEAFSRSDYVSVQRSTTAKVGLFFDILHRAHDRTLITPAAWWVMNVGRVREAAEMFRDNPLKAFGSLVAGGLISGGFAMWKLFGN